MCSRGSTFKLRLHKNMDTNIMVFVIIFPTQRSKINNKNICD